jgi:hypothetical protein
LVDVLSGADAADAGVDERHLDVGEQAGFPGGVGVGEHQDVVFGGADADGQGGAFAGVGEHHHVDAAVAAGDEAVAGFGVGQVEHDDDFGGVFGQPGVHAAVDDVGVLVEGRHDHAGGGAELVHQWAVGQRHDLADQPHRPADDADDPDRQEQLPMLGEAGGRGHARALTEVRGRSATAASVRRRGGDDHLG